MITTRPLEHSEIDEAAALLGAAFETNPNSLAIAGGEPAGARRFMEVSARLAVLRRRRARVLVAHRGERMVGVLHGSEAPYCQLSALEKLVVAPRLLAALGTSVLRVLKLQAVWAKHEPDQSHWHLGPIGVLPDSQGQGVGSRLLEAFLMEVDQRHGAAYLETDVDRNVVLYERFGFRIRAEDDFLGVSNRFMWREPR